MLTIRNFSKRYSGSLIISTPYLELHPGTYWIKGKNGSGKTTFFKSIAGLIPCDGFIEFKDGTSLHQNPVPYRRRVNYSEAEPLYPGFLTSKDLIRFIGNTRKASLHQQNSLVQKFGIDSFFEKPCETYSSGMMKKLALVIAFLGSPQIIILDEPFITLDDHARPILLAVIKQHIEENNATFLISSHQAFDSTDIQIRQTVSIENKILIPIDR